MEGCKFDPLLEVTFSVERFWFSTNTNLLLPSPAQLIPSRYHFRPHDPIAVNGSSTIARCIAPSGNPLLATCRAPASSVLFDGKIPTLTGLDGNMWASQLFTIRSNIANITFDFNGTPKITRIEMVLFNCEQWGISAQSITVEASRTSVGTINPTVTSCDSLVRVCMPLNISVQTELKLSIIPNDWVHIAELTFYEADCTCPPDTIITTPSAPMTTAGMSNGCNH